MRLPINIANHLVIAFIASSVLIAGCSNMSEPIQRAIRAESIFNSCNPDTADSQQTLPESDLIADLENSQNVIVTAPERENNTTDVQGGGTVFGLPQKNIYSDHKDINASTPAEVVLVDSFKRTEGEEYTLAKSQSFDFSGDYNDSVFEPNRRTGIKSIRNAKADSGVELPIVRFFLFGIGAKK